MNIKSLLLGSAAALAVVSGAQAADAVVAAEPEPMEYVRVCDAYGTGYFYLPGTETCLKIGGQFRYEKRWGKVDGSRSAYSNWSRGRIEVTAKNDSEWGTVSSWIRMQQSQEDNLNNNAQFYYTFGIGGLEFGFYDSQWSQFQGYGGRTDWGGYYGPFDTQYVSYTATFDSFSAIISLEHDRNQNSDPVLTTDGPDSKYMPDVFVGASATFGDWQAIAGGAYDESDESFAVFKKVKGDIGMFGVTLIGLYSNSDTNRYFSYDGFSVIAGASAGVTDSISLAADFQWWDDSSFRVIGDINWAVASGFSVLLEGSIGRPDVGPNDKSAMLRFQRSF
jgi:opacity protein-like surface antigen